MAVRLFISTVTATLSTVPYSGFKCTFWKVGVFYILANMTVTFELPEIMLVPVLEKAKKPRKSWEQSNLQNYLVQFHAMEVKEICALQTAKS